MNKVNYCVIATVVALCMAVGLPKAMAEVNVQIGVAPECPYGYYDVPPYSCAPYGYYGPEWFSGGVFIGAGPWFHGPEHFRGHVDQSFDADHFRGPRPERGAKADWSSKHLDKEFKGHDMREQGRHDDKQEDKH